MTVNAWLAPHVIIQQERDLVEDLIIESIQQKGVDCKYMIREMLNRDYLYGESPISDFKDFVVVEMYLSRTDSFNGDADIFAKFSIEHTESATLEVSSKRFREEFANKGLQRPREGDLIFHPIQKALYEIKKVKEDEEYKQLGKNYKYRLECNLFQFSHEELPGGDTQPYNDLDVEIRDDNELRRTLGLDSLIEESPQLVEEAQGIKTFDPANPFMEN